jgi:hypothetical protein
MENRSGLIVAVTLTGDRRRQRKAAEELIVRHSPGAHRITLGGDKTMTRLPSCDMPETAGSA